VNTTLNKWSALAGISAALLCPSVGMGRALSLKITDGNSNPFNAEQKSVWTWVQNAEKVKEIRIRTDVTSSRISNGASVKSVTPGGKAVVRNGRISALLNSLTTRIQLQGSDPNRLVLEYKEDKQAPVLDDRCKSVFQIALVGEDASAPFYVGISCNKDNKGLNISLSYPTEVELIDASFSELKGKGENWKYYELGPIQQTLKELGSFGFSFGGKTYRYRLISLKQLKDSVALTESVISVGMGFSMLGVSGPDIQASSGAPTVIVRVPHFEVWDRLGLSLAVDFAIPISSGVGSVKFSQFGGYFDYLIELGPRFSISPKVGYLITSQSEQSTSIGLSANQVAFGIVLKSNLGPKYVLALEALSAGLGSPVINSHYLFDLAVIRRKTGQFGWGLGFKMQNFAATSGLGLQRTFSQMLFYGLIGF
jgi:hypothetical protein